MEILRSVLVCLAIMSNFNFSKPTNTNEYVDLVKTVCVNTMNTIDTTSFDKVIKLNNFEDLDIENLKKYLWYAPVEQALDMFIYDNLYTDDNSIDIVKLGTMPYIFVKELTDNELDIVLNNKNLRQLYIKNPENLDLEKLGQLYDYICTDNIELSTLLLAYSNYNDSIGNDGTDIYKNVIAKYCNDIVVYRSCASVVSAALNATGFVENYSTAGVSGLINYFDKHEDNWTNMGKLTADEMQCGDIVFINRHTDTEKKTVEEDYGAALTYEEAVEVLNEEIENATDERWTYNHIFYPDTDENGVVEGYEAEYWNNFWYWRYGYVPDYDYFYTWVEEASNYKNRRIEELMQTGNSSNSNNNEENSGKVIHDHIFVWLGNDVVQKYYPDSKGNIVSGSYTENYGRARSAAISTYNFTENYTVYRYNDNEGVTVKKVTQ